MLTIAMLLWAGAAFAEEAPKSLPEGALRVPNVRQATEYTCGAASLQAVLAYWGVYDGAEADLARRLGTDSDQGTKVTAIVAEAKEFGLEAEAREHMTVDDLRAALKRGDTVILDIQAWADWRDKKPPLRGAQWRPRWEDGHYVVLVAMDEKNAYFMDPSVIPGHGWIPLDELPERWRDYDGKGRNVRRYERLGIVIRGKTPADPPVLTRID